MKKTDKLKKYFCGEFNRRDRIIEGLRKENLILLKSALKQSKKCIEVESLLRAIKLRKQ